MTRKILVRIIGTAFTFAALTTVSSCSLLQQNAMPHFSGEGKCPVCGTIVTKHPVAQTSTVDKSFLEEILNKDYSIKEYNFEVYEPKRMEWKDDTITELQENLLPFMKSNTILGNKCLMPSSASVNNSSNELYLYFTEDAQGNAQDLHLRLQYYADDPLNYNDMVFTIDGFEYKFHPVNIKRGKGDGIMIWEQSDDVVKVGDKDLVYALAHCNWAQLKLHGADDMSHVKLISDDQLKTFKQTLELFLLRGGQINE